MARRKRRQPAKPTSILPAWIWLTLGILVGLGISMLTRMIDGKNLQHQVNEEQPSQPTYAEPEKRKFDFYTLLPELEIVIPQDEKNPPKTNQSTKKSASYTGGYLLQAGSFQKLDEADSLKARLALIGVEANIQSVNVNNTAWHRVHIGPSNDRQVLEKLQERLRNNHIDTLLMQAKK